MSQGILQFPLMEIATLFPRDNLVARGEANTARAASTVTTADLDPGVKVQATEIS
jgi:hypothetical protein